MKRKMPKRETIERVKASNRNQRETKIEYDERTERLRHVLESRRAKSANDKEKVQSAAPKDNIDGSNDAKKTK